MGAYPPPSGSARTSRRHCTYFFLSEKKEIIMKRICSICKQEKELDEHNFPKNFKRKGGFEGRCKVCRKAKDKARYEAKKEKILEQKKRYYEKNADKIKERQLGYYNENKGKCRQSEKDWCKNNPTRRRMTCAKSRTLKYGSESTLTEKEWLEIKSFFCCSCAYCGMPEKKSLEIYGEHLHQEHVVPLIDGGAYSYGNVVPACRSCNSSKRNHDFFVWYKNSNVFSRKRYMRIVQYLKDERKEQKID